MLGVTRFGRWGDLSFKGGIPAGVAATASAAAAGLGGGGTGVIPVGLATAAATIAATYLK